MRLAVAGVGLSYKFLMMGFGSAPRPARKQFFFAKKNQKTLINKSVSGGLARALTDKSFLLLFCKKEVLS
jgi:hypothetical protein